MAAALSIIPALSFLSLGLMLDAVLTKMGLPTKAARERVVRIILLGYSSLVLPVTAAVILGIESLQFLFMAHFIAGLFCLLAVLVNSVERVIIYIAGFVYRSEEVESNFPTAIASAAVVVGYFIIAWVYPPRGWDALHFYFPHALTMFQMEQLPDVNPLNFLPTFKPPANVIVLAYGMFATRGVHVELLNFPIIVGLVLVTERLAEQMGLTHGNSLRSGLLLLTTPLMYFLVYEYYYYQDLYVAFFTAVATSVVISINQFLATNPQTHDEHAEIAKELNSQSHAFADDDEATKDFRHETLYSWRQAGLMAGLGSLAMCMAVLSKFSGYAFLLVLFLVLRLPRRLEVPAKLMVLAAVTPLLVRKAATDWYIGTATVVVLLLATTAVLIVKTQVSGSSPRSSWMSSMCATILFVPVIITGALWLRRMLRLPGIQDMLTATYIDSRHSGIQWSFPAVTDPVNIWMENAMGVSFAASALTIVANSMFGITRGIFLLVGAARSFDSERRPAMIWLTSFYAIWLTYFAATSTRYLAVVLVPLAILTIEGLSTVVQWVNSQLKGKAHLTETFQTLWLAALSFLYLVPLFPFEFVFQDYNTRVFNHNLHIIRLIGYGIAFLSIGVGIEVYLTRSATEVSEELAAEAVSPSSSTPSSEGVGNEDESEMPVNTTPSSSSSSSRSSSSPVIVTNAVGKGAHRACVVALVALVAVAPMGGQLVLFAGSGFDQDQFIADWVYYDRQNVQDIVVAIQIIAEDTTEAIISSNTPWMETKTLHPTVDLYLLGQVDGVSNFFTNPNCTYVLESLSKLNTRMIVSIEREHVWHDAFIARYHGWSVYQLAALSGLAELNYDNSEFSLYVIEIPEDPAYFGPSSLSLNDGNDASDTTPVAMAGLRAYDSVSASLDSLDLMLDLSMLDIGTANVSLHTEWIRSTDAPSVKHPVHSVIESSTSDFSVQTGGETIVQLLDLSSFDGISLVGMNLTISGMINGTVTTQSFTMTSESWLWFGSQSQGIALRSLLGRGIILA